MNVSDFKKLPFILSDAAKVEVENIYSTKNIPKGYGLRVGIKGGGCSGVSYLFGFDMLNASDEQFDLDGIPVFIEKKHFMYIAGLIIDFEDGPNIRGFTFDNPSTKF